MTGTYQGFSVTIPVTVVKAPSSYFAIDFAKELLKETDPICESSTDKNNDLKPVWATLETEYFSLLDEEDVEILRKAEAKNGGTKVQVAMARYDFIVTHYSNCGDFIGRNPKVQAKSITEKKDLSKAKLIGLIIGISGFSISSIAVIMLIKKSKRA